MAFQVSRSPEAFSQVFRNVRHHFDRCPHLYSQFLTLVEELLLINDSYHIEQTITRIAELLKTLPAAFYQLNPLFHPHARVEFDIRYSPINSFVLKTQTTSRIVVLDSSCDLPLLGNLSASQFGAMLGSRAVGDRDYDDLYEVTNPALQACLAQLAQDLIDDPEASKPSREQALKFLRRPAGVPPSLLLYDLKEHGVFTYTSLSDLYKGTLGGLKVIIKKPRIRKDSLDNSEIIREIILCRQLRHPYILPFLGVSFDEQNHLYGLVTPFMKNGNVVEFLRLHPDLNRLTPVWQVTKGLEFLHNFSPGVAHRDIKSGNILVNDEYFCRLSDFGLSSIPDVSQRSQDQAPGTFLWMAPEVLLQRERVDWFKADVFSLGVTILEICTGNPPTRFAQGLRPCLPPTCPFSFPPFLCELVSMMLNDDPDRRPSIRLICQALEDNLIFPREMNTKAKIQESDAKSRDMHAEGISAREVAREWVLNEREREKVDKKVDATETTALRSGLPCSAVPPRTGGNSTLVYRDLPSDLLRRAARRATASRTTHAMSPLSELEICRGLPTPVTDVSSPNTVTASLPYQTALHPTRTPEKAHIASLPTPLDTPRSVSTIIQPRPTQLRPTQLFDNLTLET